MKIYIIAFLLVIFQFLTVANAQENETKKDEKDKRPVKSPFSTGALINGQTIVVNPAKTLQFNIQHRFGKINSQGIKDLYGLFGASNIRLGISYNPIENLQIGFGTTKNYKLQDLNWKWSILRQTRSGSVPFAVTYYGNVVYDARDKTYFTNPDPADSIVHSSWRFAYFHQILIGRKFGKKFALQLAPSITHFNLVDSISYGDLKHDNISVSVAGRYNFSAQSSIIFEYSHPLTASEDVGTKPDMGIGLEVATSGHAFQIFLTTASGINDAYNAVYNTNDFTLGEMVLGFNISRKWRF